MEAICEAFHQQNECVGSADWGDGGVQDVWAGAGSHFKLHHLDNTSRGLQPQIAALMTRVVFWHHATRHGHAPPVEGCVKIIIASILQVGALVAGVVFGLVPDRTVFYISACCGVLGAVTTFLLVPDISGLDLSEGAATGDKNGTSSALQNLPVQQQLLVVLGAVQSGWQQACARTEALHCPSAGIPCAGCRRWMLLPEGQG